MIQILFCCQLSCNQFSLRPTNCQSCFPAPPPPPPIPPPPTSPPPDCVPNEDCILLMEGCMFFAKVLCNTRRFKEFQSIDLLKEVCSNANDGTDSVLFIPPLDEEWSIFSKESWRVSSSFVYISRSSYACLKKGDYQIPMRRLINYSVTVSLVQGESGAPAYKDLVHSYERHSMLLNGYDVPEISCLPYA